MLTLLELQNGFRQSVAGDAPGELLHLIAGDGFDSAARLSIYRNNVAMRLTDTLSVAYPVVCQLVDRPFFEFAADAFLRQNLPVSGCLSDYGGEFPSFLAQFPAAADPKYLADVARLEWAIHQVRHAAALPPLTIGALASMPGDPSKFRLELVPAVQFIASPFAVDRIWVAHQIENSWEDLQLKNTAAQLQIDGRRGLDIVKLSPSTWAFRACIAAGETLGTSVETALAASSDFDTPSALATLFSDDLVAVIN